MQKQTKMIVGISVILILAAVTIRASRFLDGKGDVWFSITKMTGFVPSWALRPFDVPVSERQLAVSERTIEGTIVSIGEKQVYLGLGDGVRGTAINISPAVPVRNEAGSVTGNQSLLKNGQAVRARVDTDDNATEILILR